MMSEEQKLGTVADIVVNRWLWWQNALKGDFGPIHDGEPQQGYYATKEGEPVAIWQDDDGNWIAYRNKREVRAEEIWTWVCQRPISYNDYKHAKEHGHLPSEPPAPVIGHNSGDEDPFEQIRIEIAGETEQADEFLKQSVDTQEDADKAAIWSKRIGALAKKAEDHRKVEKQPHLDAGRAVDDKWRGVTDTAKDYVSRLKKHVEPFLIAQKRAEEERQRKEREKAEELRRKAADEVKENDEAKADLIAQAEAAEKEAASKKVDAGRTGAKVSIRKEKVGVVTDYNKAAIALVNMKHKDLISLIDQLANRAARSGMPFDGMEIKEVEKVV